MEIRQCSQCKNFKYLNNFYQHTRSGYFSKCKKCVLQENKVKNDKKRALRLKTHQQFLQDNNFIGKKKCPQCNRWKDPKQFSFNSRTIDKLDCWCRDCKNKRHDVWYYGTKEKEQKEHQQFLERNNLIGKTLCKRCKEWKTSDKFTKASGVCDKCVLKQAERYYKKNRERLLSLARKWRKENRKRVNFLRARWGRQQYQTNLKFKLNDNISSRMRQSLKNGSGKGNRHWESLVPYNLTQLKRHLARTMPINHSWQDFLTGELHLEHRIPISAFNFTKSSHIDFQRCWALSNLRLLPAKENLKKRDKLIDHFQTCFRI